MFVSAVVSDSVSVSLSESVSGSVFVSVSLCSAQCSVQFLLELTLHSSCSCGGVFAGALTLPWNPRGLKVVRVYPQLLRVGSKRKFQGVQKKNRRKTRIPCKP